MKNKDAKRLMLECIGSRPNGECFILEVVSIKTADLKNGSVTSMSTYIGDLDEPQTQSNVSEFCKRLALPKQLMTKGLL